MENALRQYWYRIHKDTSPFPWCILALQCFLSQLCHQANDEMGVQWGHRDVINISQVILWLANATKHRASDDSCYETTSLTCDCWPAGWPVRNVPWKTQWQSHGWRKNITVFFLILNILWFLCAVGFHATWDHYIGPLTGHQGEAQLTLQFVLSQSVSVMLEDSETVWYMYL